MIKTDIEKLKNQKIDFAVGFRINSIPIIATNVISFAAKTDAEIIQMFRNRIRFRDKTEHGADDARVREKYLKSAAGRRFLDSGGRYRFPARLTSVSGQAGIPASGTKPRAFCWGLFYIGFSAGFTFGCTDAVGCSPILVF